MENYCPSVLDRFINRVMFKNMLFEETIVLTRVLIRRSFQPYLQFSQMCFAVF